MLTRINAAKCVGISALPVTVETEIERGIGIHLVGLGDTAVKESLLRIVTALESLGFHIPGKKIVINLAPADLRKNGSGYDLPIALGIIMASDERRPFCTDGFLLLGELGLDGSLRRVQGSLIFAEYALNNGYKGIILPYESALEACEIEGLSIFGARNLPEVLGILSGDEDCIGRCLLTKDSVAKAAPPASSAFDIPDFSEIIGQAGAKRALEIACAGGHNIIFVGSPGSGKSSLAKAAAGILPPMSREESLRVSKIYSLCDNSPQFAGLIRKRPFRAPHCASSIAALIGGGGADNIVPGEVTLADSGVLFLDEFSQMAPSIIESLRAPLEDRRVTISRLRAKVEFPASFMLIAASNPCPCGYYGEGDRCTCSPYKRSAYMAKLSGPIMDRIDIQVRVRPVQVSSLRGKRAPAESSAAVAARVAAARAIQSRRFAGEGILTNAEMGNRLIEKLCPLSPECRETLESVMEKSGLSMRAYFRLIKVARTIADLESVAAGSPPLPISAAHILEAAGYRFLDKAPE